MRMLGRWAAIALIFAFLAAPAWADEVVGKIQKVDRDQKMFVLEDGTELWAGEGTSLEQLDEGKKVKAAYEEKDGRKWATSIEIVTE